ncbi:MAG: tRNA (adenosine(37)-N6)-threonylcarbamoyltransferase complex ATPase subunit type 1 TsaE [Candidatus Falkowbacteria bacterium]
MPEIIIKSEKEMSAFARKYARDLRGGDVLGLIGDLGAGKTFFTGVLGKTLGVKRTVNSPTFVLMKIYKTRNTETIRNIAHIDAYRIKSTREISDIGADEYINRPDTLTVIEWADKIKKVLPKKTKFIKIKHDKNNQRIIKY